MPQKRLFWGLRSTLPPTLNFNSWICYSVTQK